MNPSKIGLIVTGSIAAYKAADVASRLVQQGHEVRVVLTESGGRFVGPATFEALTGQRVLTDLFAPGDALEHIQFTRWADLVLVCPATADALNRFAAGLAGDLAGSLFLARDPAKPWLVAPAMNPKMWRHPATQAAVERLAEWGLRFIPVAAGRTACDEYGEGRLADPCDIVAAVEAAGGGRQAPLRILVTSGGTSEPIDAVRVLTNTSTGRTGARIAEHFHRQGHEVTLLRAQNAERGLATREETFFTYGDLDRALTRLLGENDYDAVIHAAAVGDFGIEAIRVGDALVEPGSAKLDSGTAPVLVLRRNRKLLDGLRALSRNSAIRIVAFKLTSGSSPDLQPLAAAADLIVHNDAGERRSAEVFPADLYWPDGRKWAHCATRSDLAVRLEEFLSHAAVS
ncbi:MAG TPA: bifunctional phosphopantothenoylcysteine decarboxylase/phosphopantothenate--cysteine ligase CoaBC [Opitutaceae bacterium]|jgi:phosphopantothenoylcysteine decarboxylase/phosphopantothenate--cysteine ligase|nr:bifunctional phosphopantothenoylcysteine decarboxylase/phosphopantothenate--cysteine ligase CoaBC [Opitutaceae bacterium]